MHGTRRLQVALALGLFSGALAVPQAAEAQAIAAFVNGEPITTYDIDQRARINRLGRQPTSRQAVLNELIDDKVKLAEARRVGYRVMDHHIDDQIQRQAKSNNQTLVEFNQSLNKAGVDMNAFRERLRANYAWELAMDRRNRGGQQDSIFGDPSAGRSTEYTLYSVIFVVPRGTGAGAKMAQANAARARFSDCTTGLAQLRSLPDVAVRPPVRRLGSELSPQLQKVLDATPVNRMTAPFPSDQGVEAIAVCEKVQRGTAARTDAAKKTADSAAYLKSLRAKAVIQYR